MDVFAAAQTAISPATTTPTRCLPKPAGLIPRPASKTSSAALAQALRPGATLKSHPDTGAGFQPERFLSRAVFSLSAFAGAGEAVESALALFVQTLQRRAELQNG